MTLQLRFKLFQSVITSTVLYSLETCPLTDHLLERLNITRRKMMRKMIGWNFVANDTWESAGRKMKDRLQHCANQLRLKEWSEQVNERKRKVVEVPTERNHWMYHSIRWYPPCCSHLNSYPCVRARGHPHTKWDDGIKAKSRVVV